MVRSFLLNSKCYFKHLMKTKILLWYKYFRTSSFHELERTTKKFRHNWKVLPGIKFAIGPFFGENQKLSISLLDPISSAMKENNYLQVFDVNGNTHWRIMKNKETIASLIHRRQQRIRKRNRRNRGKYKKPRRQRWKNKDNNNRINKRNHRKTKNEPGWDMVTNRMPKDLPEEFLEERMKKLFNCILEQQRYPKEWKKVIMIPKQGKSRKLSENFRPISLISHTSKIIDRIILRIIKEEEEQIEIIPN